MAAVITEAIRAESDAVEGIGSDYEIKYGFHVPEDYFFKSGRVLSHELVDAISSHKSEPDWMRTFRHRSRGRDHRQAGRSLSVHDDPELVDERLQPGHEAGRRRTRGDDGVRGREPRLEADDESIRRSG